MRLPQLALVLALTVTVTGPVDAAPEPISIGLLREHSSGSVAATQPYVDKLAAVIVKENGWAAGKGHYDVARAAFTTWVDSAKPHFAVLSLPAFLAYKDKYKLEVIGQATWATGGGQQYHLVSKTAVDLAGCKGKTLATDHADDPKFVEKIVFAGKVKLSEFTVVTTTRFEQAAKKVVEGEAVCALLDDAQLAELAKMANGAAAKSVWKSDKLPSPAVVAFPAAPAAERKAFQSYLPKMCAGLAKPTCGVLGLQVVTSVGAADYGAVLAAYAKP